jgi:uncharacterized protein
MVAFGKLSPRKLRSSRRLKAYNRTGLQALQQSEPRMKLHLDKVPGRNIFTAYGDDFVAVNGTRYETSLVVAPDRLEADWPPVSLDRLSAQALLLIRDMRPEIVLLGTGTVQRFPAPQLLRVLIEARIGVEIMDNRAACRTYNVLAGEERRVAAALIFPPRSG